MAQAFILGFVDWFFVSSYLGAGYLAISSLKVFRAFVGGHHSGPFKGSADSPQLSLSHQSRPHWLIGGLKP
jgi:hypothetical protein